MSAPVNKNKGKRKGGAEKAREKNIKMREKEAASCKPIDEIFKRFKPASDTSESSNVAVAVHIDNEDVSRPSTSAGCSNILDVPVVTLTRAECESQVRRKFNWLFLF